MNKLVGKKEIIYEEEDLSEEDDTEYEEDAIVKKKNIPKKIKPRFNEYEQDEFEFDKSASKTYVKRQYKKSPDDEVDAIAITYEIDSELHPFFHLNNVPDSVELSKLKLSKEEVKFI